MDSGRLTGEDDRERGAGAGFRFSSVFVPDAVRLLDAGLILVAAVLPYWIYVPYHGGLIEYYVFAALFVCAVSVAMLQRSGMYEIAGIMRPAARSDVIVVSIASAFLFLLTIAFSLKVSELYSRVWLWSFAGGSVSLVLGARLVLQRLLVGLAARRVIGRSVVVLAAGRQGRRFLETFDEKRPDFARIVGVFSAEPRHGERIAGHPVLGTAAELPGYLRAHPADDVVIAMPFDSENRLEETIDALKELPLNVYISSQFLDYQLRFHPALGHPRDMPLFEVVQRPISGWGTILKAVEDYVLGTLLVVALSPLLLAIAVAIKLDSPGPVFFTQPRLGFNNRTFRIFKFRSMYHRKVPERRVQQASRGDPRVTRVGRFIRRTSLDELPQLFNVLNGTMSLVGPRPHAISHNEDYGARIRGYFARHKVKPGITGWAQINNLRGETETLCKMEARVRHDIYYAENWSLLFDLRILIVTVFVVLFQKSAY
jgi:Undecaprenyl-phosphate glucose phosphotransferase